MPLLEQVLGQYPKDVKLIFKNFPLPNHKFAMKAATTAMAADRLGKFWEFHDLLFKNYNQLNDEKLKEIVKELGLDENALEIQMLDPRIVQKIKQDYSDGINAGVTGTPTIFVNGKLLKDRSLAGFSQMINQELRRAQSTRR